MYREIMHEDEFQWVLFPIIKSALCEDVDGNISAYLQFFDKSWFSKQSFPQTINWIWHLTAISSSISSEQILRLEKIHRWWR